MSFILLMYLACLLEELSACSNIYRKTYKNGPVYQGHGQPIIKYRYLSTPRWSSLNSVRVLSHSVSFWISPGNSLCKRASKTPTTWSKSRKPYYINSQFIFVSPKWIHCWIFHWVIFESYPEKVLKGTFTFILLFLLFLYVTPQPLNCKLCNSVMPGL